MSETPSNRVDIEKGQGPFQADQQVMNVWEKQAQDFCQELDKQKQALQVQKQVISIESRNKKEIAMIQIEQHTQKLKNDDIALADQQLEAESLYQNKKVQSLWKGMADKQMGGKMSFSSQQDAQNMQTKLKSERMSEKRLLKQNLTPIRPLQNEESTNSTELKAGGAPPTSSIIGLQPLVANQGDLQESRLSNQSDQTTMQHSNSIRTATTQAQDQDLVEQYRQLVSDSSFVPVSMQISPVIQIEGQQKKADREIEQRQNILSQDSNSLNSLLSQNSSSSLLSSSTDSSSSFQESESESNTTVRVSTQRLSTVVELAEESAGSNISENVQK